MRARASWLVWWSLAACGADSPAAVDAGGQAADAARAAPSVVAHEFPSVEVVAGEELASLCQSWTLNNTEPIYVNAVHMRSGYGWHHSNWFYAPDDRFAGDDGTWECASRGFDTFNAALVGGVLYAQSTQTTGETQQFQPGAAVIIPPHSRILGEIHLLNASDTAIDTSIELTITPIPEADVQTALTPLELHYAPLRLPAQQRSEFFAECDYAEAYGAPITFSVHYVMPHYHALGESMRIETYGGDRDGELVFQSEAPIGEPMGGTLDPPFDLTGAAGLRFTCAYDNPRDTTVGWGIGDQEMCMALLFTDSPVLWAGGVESGRRRVESDGDVARFDGPCDLYTLAPHF